MKQKENQKWIELACPDLGTPVLTGKDAERFLKRMREVKPLPKAEKERLKKLYESITWEI